MLQAVIYFIVTMILTKELVIATDNCTEYQFKTPYSYVGESCADIYSKNAKSHKWPGYYTIVYKVYCGMTYTGSSCENIFKRYPEIHRSNPSKKSGYYRLNNNQWTYCDMTEIATGAADFISMCSVVEVGESRMKSYNYQSFLPGKSCESIYNSSKDSHNSPQPGNYWITSRVYCGMNYTELSCKNIYTNFPETQNKSGYYRIKEKNDYQWTYCSMTTITSSGDFISYQRVCGRARGYQKGDTVAFYGSHSAYNKTIDEDYVSGLSITYGGNPRQHIWTFASGRGENYNNLWNCPCSVNGGYSPSSFVGNNYYCESGSVGSPIHSTYYFNDMLWDGAGCIDNCCDDTTLPWFHRQLNQITQDDIEARICDEGPFREGSPLIDQLELYIQ